MHSQPTGKMPVHRGNARTGIHHEQHHRCPIQGGFRLQPHASGKAFRIAFLKTSRINNMEGKIRQTANTCTAIPRNTGGIVHKGKASAHQAIEQSRLPHIGAPNDGYRKSMFRHAFFLSAICDEVRTLGQKIHGTIGDHRRCQCAIRQFLCPKKIARIRRYGQDIAMGRGNDQTVASQHGASP